VQEQTPPRPKTAEEASKVWPYSQAGKVSIASAAVAEAVRELKEIKAQIKDLEVYEGRLTDIIKPAFEDAESLQCDGQLIATWKTSKASQTFDMNRFKQVHPAIWEAFQIEKPGSRRLILK